MKIAAYQFAVTSDIDKNFRAMESAIRKAAERNVNLLLFPECSLTGYPPRDIPTSADVNIPFVKECCDKIQKLCDETGVAVIYGTIDKNADGYYNRAFIMRPGTERESYDKRALWGWDRDNFSAGKKNGIFELNGFKIGVRICFEVRFPEYFRELYAEKTDLDLVLFYDVSDNDDLDRYNMIKGHLQTRAMENICPILTSNTIRPYQTAPTALFGRNGETLSECHRNTEDQIEFDLEKSELYFGEQGRKEISDSLMKERRKA